MIVSTYGHCCHGHCQPSSRPHTVPPLERVKDNFFVLCQTNDVNYINLITVESLLRACTCPNKAIVELRVNMSQLCKCSRRTLTRRRRRH